MRSDEVVILGFMRIPINTDESGNAKTVLAGYYKYGCANLLGVNFGTTGTAIMEIYEHHGE